MQQIKIFALNLNLEYIQTDILIIGSGLSGDVATFVAADEGKNVLFITKTSEMKRGNTPWDQGEIVYISQSDSPDKLKTDITQAGDHHCWDEAVELICNEEPPLVMALPWPGGQVFAVLISSLSSFIRLHSIVMLTVS